MRKKLFSFLTIVILLFTACGTEESVQEFVNAEYQKSVITQDYYFTSGTEKNVLEYTLREVDGLELTISSPKTVDEDRHIAVDITPDLLDAFNSKHLTSYSLLPTDSYELINNEQFIPVGETTTRPFIFLIKSAAAFEKGTTYCVPISIVKSSDNATLKDEYKTIYLVIKPEQTYAAVFGNGLRYNVPFGENSGLENLSECSFETLIKVKKFNDEDPGISTIMGIEENFLLRFGDANIENNRLQFSMIGGAKVESKMLFETDKWYHIAMVYDGSSVKLYINGELDKEQRVITENVSLIQSFTQTGFQISQAYNEYDLRYMHASISEMRVWSRTLSQDEIRSNSRFLPRNSYYGLVAYWPFNDQKNVIKDYSGNGYDITPSKSGDSDFELDPKDYSPSWEILN